MTNATLIDQLCRFIKRLDDDGQYVNAALVYEAVKAICEATKRPEPYWADYQITI
jgi:hypothetical protein